MSDTFHYSSSSHGQVTAHFCRVVFREGWITKMRTIGQNEVVDLLSWIIKVMASGALISTYSYSPKTDCDLLLQLLHLDD